MDKSGPYAIPKHSELEVSPSYAPEIASRPADWNHNAPSFPQQQQQYINTIPPHQGYHYSNGASIAGDPSPSKKRRICGLTMFQLIVVILLLLSIVVGAVLGGVFGSDVLHRSSSSSTSSDSTPSVAIPNLPDISSTTVVGGSTRLVTAAPTATTTKSRSYTFASATSSAAPTGISAKNCNNGTTYSTTTTSPSVGFLILCQIDWPAGAQYGNARVKDVSWSENVPTLRECMEGCGAWNRDNRGGAQEMCRAVVWNYKEQCYLKNQTGPEPDTFYEYANHFVQAAVLLQSA